MTTLRIFCDKKMSNFPVMEVDIDNVDENIRKILQCLKGETMRKKSIHAREILVRLPYNIIASYGGVTLTADVMSANGHKIFITHSRHLRFTTT